MSLPGQEKIYSVSKLNREIRGLLEQGFASLQLTGEISNFVAPASGHWYFSLKDDKAQVKAAMWRGNNRYCRYRPENGAQVIVTARVSVYEPRGDYQLIVEQMAPAGEGLLKQQFEKLKMQLAAEGLFSQSNKQPLPQQINTVGVVTSATGAAIKDILSVLKRRAPQLNVIIYPSLVQGDEAAENIAKQISLANTRNEVDVLIVGRGGGSLEDLWCFNDERVARALFNSKLPTISAVGHEIDTTISDYVADLRAPTPSAAAELVSPDSQALQMAIGQKLVRLKQAFTTMIDRKQEYIESLGMRLSRQHPQQQLMQQSQRLDELKLRLERAATTKVSISKARQMQYFHKLQSVHPEQSIKLSQARHKQLFDRLHKALLDKQNQSENQLAILSAKLDAVSPLAVLGRGYAITKKHDKVINSIAKVKVGDELTTEFTDGLISSRVIEIDSKKPK